MRSPIPSTLSAACTPGSTNPLDPAAWNTVDNVNLSITVAGTTSGITVTPKLYSTANLATEAAPTAALAWDGVNTCSNIVRYLEVTYALSPTLAIDPTSVRVKVVYGILTDSATATPTLMYSAVARNTVNFTDPELICVGYSWKPWICHRRPSSGRYPTVRHQQVCGSSRSSLRS